GGQRRSVLHLSTAALSGPPAAPTDVAPDVHASEVVDPFADAVPDGAAEAVGAASAAEGAETSSVAEGHTASATLDVQCFGGFVVRCGGRELSPRLTEGGQSKATHVGWEAL